MRQFFLLLLITAFASSTVQAQDKAPVKKKLDWGLKTGLNLSTLNGSVESADDPSWKNGFVFGAFFRIKAGANFSVQPEFVYSSMGAKIANGFDEKSSLRLNYFSIPVLAKYKFAKNWAAVAGPQFDFLIVAKQVVDDQSTKVSGSYEDNSMNVTGGLEFWPTKCIGLGARYIHGLNDIRGDNSSGPSIRNQGIQLSFAVKL